MYSPGQGQGQGHYYQGAPPPGFQGGPPHQYAPNFPGGMVGNVQGNQGYPSPGQYVPPGPYTPSGPAYVPQQSYAPSQPYVPPSYVPPGYGHSPPPVVHQPGQVPPPQPSAPGGWMSIPPGQGGCPPGLEYLTMIDQLLVHQKVELLEALTGFETNNKFTVKNSVGQKVYYAVEDTDCCTRNCCGPLRPFEMKILDNYRNQVINLHRPLACDSCCFPCCLQSMEVSSPPGNLIGSIQQQWSILTPLFNVCDASGNTVLIIKGPFCTFSMCGDVEFKVFANDGETVVGRISKQWSGLLREMFTDADYFGITFPMDLDVRIKAVLLGACFLIDAMFFEKQANRERDLPGMI